MTIVVQLESTRHRKYHSSDIREEIELLVHNYTRELRREQRDNELNNYKTVFISEWKLFTCLNFLGKLDNRGKLRIHNSKESTSTTANISAAVSCISSQASSTNTAKQSKECRKSKQCNSKISITSDQIPKTEKEKVLQKWNTEKLLFLIEQYEKKRRFWCRNEENYISDTKQRKEVFRLLTSRLNAKFQENFTHIQVKTQINRLRARFFTLNQKFGAETQGGEIQQLEWEFYKPLQFLANQELRSHQSVPSTASSRKRTHSAMLVGPRPLLASKSVLFNEQSVEQASLVKKQCPIKIRRCSSDPCVSVHSPSARRNQENSELCNSSATAVETQEDETVDVETVDSEEEEKSENSNLLAKTNSRIPGSSSTNTGNPTTSTTSTTQTSTPTSNVTTVLDAHCSTQENNHRVCQEIELIDLTLSDDEEDTDQKVDLKYSSTVPVSNSARRPGENEAMCTELAKTVTDRLICLASASDQSKVKEKMEMIRNILYAAEFN
uniref:MADF domain-containing protein n=1 Tax=Ditylenchus dipsaci TaxID=166011 RepID=A0A915E555_9BILA